MTEERHQRRIRSFVLRQGRMTVGQQNAYDRQWPQKGLQVSDGLLDPQVAFGRSAPLVLEIGFGMGHSLVEMAEHEADKDFIGVEVHTPGVGKLFQLGEQQGVENIRVYAEDAIEVLTACIRDNSLQRLQLFFPDPWHKKRHHKRRIVQPDFVQLVRAKLAPGGVFHMATDWEAYAEHMVEVMQAAEGFKNLAPAESSPYVPRPENRPLTKFEKRGERLGHGVWDLLFEKSEPA